MAPGRPRKQSPARWATTVLGTRQSKVQPHMHSTRMTSTCIYHMCMGTDLILHHAWIYSFLPRCTAPAHAHLPSTSAHRCLQAWGPLPLCSTHLVQSLALLQCGQEGRTAATSRNPWLSGNKRGRGLDSGGLLGAGWVLGAAAGSISRGLADATSFPPYWLPIRFASTPTTTPLPQLLWEAATWSKQPGLTLPCLSSFPVL